LARLPAVLVGHVQRDEVGLGDVRRHHRPLHRAPLPLHPPAADDLDLRNARDPPRGEGGCGSRRRGGPRVSGSGARLYGLMAEFESRQSLVEATRQAREAGFVKLDAYSPYPIEALAEALDIHDRKLPAVVLGGGILGGLCGYALCYWTSVIAYPLNVGGKPFHSAPAFIIPTFECTILFAAFAAVLRMLALDGRPTPYAPAV